MWTNTDDIEVAVSKVLGTPRVSLALERALDATQPTPALLAQSEDKSSQNLETWKAWIDTLDPAVADGLIIGLCVPPVGKQRKRKRSTVSGMRVLVTLDPKFVEDLDHEASRRNLTRAALMRLLLRQGLSDPVPSSSAESILNVLGLHSGDELLVKRMGKETRITVNQPRP